MSLAAVRDLRVARAPVTAEDLAALQTDVLAGFVLAGFVLARAAAGLPDGTIASDGVMRPAGGSLPAESGTCCPARLDGRFASTSALHPALRVLTSWQRS